MVLESTVICVDTSDFMRNGDFIPTRLQAQQDAVNVICHSKMRSNPENNVGLITLASIPEVLLTCTSDVGRVLAKLHQVQPKGNINFLSGVKVAHLALKHRQGRNHRMRIVVFIGSPIDVDEKEIVKAAKRLKKEKVNVDVVNFGEETINTDKLTSFVNTINGKDGTGSHLVTVPPGPILSDALLSSPIVVGEDGQAPPGMGAGSGFEFGVDPSEDPELALALRVSMEEQRARQEDEARKAAVESATDADKGIAVSSEEQSLEQALAMSMTPSAEPTPASIDYDNLSEEEQIAMAMQMSMAGSAEDAESPAAMETDETLNDEDKGEDYSNVMDDPEFLQSVLENLPGVDPQSESVRTAMGSLTKSNKKDEKKDGK